MGLLTTINIRTEKEDKKIERVIHEIAKAKLSVCCLQEVRRLKQGEINESFINTTVEKLRNVDQNCTNSVINEHLISSIKSSAEETLPIKEKTQLYQP